MEFYVFLASSILLLAYETKIIIAFFKMLKTVPDEEERLDLFYDLVRKSAIVAFPYLLILAFFAGVYLFPLLV